MAEIDAQSIAPGQPVVIDLLRPEDAPGVVSLFLYVYGESYPVRTFLDPELLIQENAARRTISSVARTPTGDIVGHTAVFHSAPFTGIYEAGAGVVHPAYRGAAGIFSRCGAHGQQMLAERFGGQGIHGEPVCNHVISQKLDRLLGWTTHAVEVDLMPAEAYAKEKSAAGRVSTLVDFMTLRPRPHDVFLPQVHEQALRFIYAGLDDQRRLLPAQGRPPANLRTRINAQVFEFAQVARLAVDEAGEDLAACLEGEEQAAGQRGMTVFQVWLRLSRPWVGWAVDELRRRGYFLGGLLPRWFDDDALLMQRMTHRPHWESMALKFDRAKEIVRLARQDWDSLQN